MKYSLVVAAFLTCITSVFAQANFEPQILILAPNEIKADKQFQKKIATINKEFPEVQDDSEMEEYFNSPAFANQPENIRQMIQSEFEFSKELDFFKRISLISEQYLAYRFYEKFPNLLIKLKNAKSEGSLDDLKKHSEIEGLQYVLNFPSIEIYEESKAAYAEIEVQLFDRQSGSLLLDKSYMGDWNNPGFEFSCKNQTIQCTINNALSKALADVIYTVAINSPTLLREKQLEQERFEALLDEYSQLTSEKELLSNIIQPSEENINLASAYKTLFNDEETKFVAFFAKEISNQDFSELQQNKKDRNVNIISNKDIKDAGFLEEVPRKYAYIVKGVKFNNHWYYSKDKVTYFDAVTFDEGRIEYFNNLQQWNFFEENTASFNPEFWETGLFAKVIDLKEDPDWEEYGESIWKTEEINNREFIGLYEIVADELRKQNREENKTFAEELNREVFMPGYEKLKKDSPEEFNKISEHSLIFSKDRTVAINPVLVTNAAGAKRIRYFVAIRDSGEMFEWTYFEPLKIESEMWGGDVVDQISSLTNWNFSVDNLNDEDFWKNYVLAEEVGSLKYLRKID